MKLWTKFLTWAGYLSRCCKSPLYWWDYNKAYCEKCDTKQ